MKKKSLVRNCLEQMKNAADIEVSIKCRIGIGKEFNYDFFSEFISEIVKSEIAIVYVHARNAILNGISPKGNRTIPPLNYDFVKRIKSEHPKVQFILNGGIENLENAFKLSNEYDGIMVGRLVQNNPFCLSKVDKIFFNYSENKIINEKMIMEYFNYIKPKIKTESIFRLLSPILQIFFGIPNSKKFKADIHNNMKNQKINELESLFLEFIKQKTELIT